MEELTEVQVIEMLQRVAVWSDQQHDSIDYDTVEGQRLRIAGMSIHKALDALTGKRDIIIQNEMKRSKANLAAFAEWCHITGRTDMTYMGNERDYAALAAQARTEMEAQQHDTGHWKE